MSIVVINGVPTDVGNGAGEIISLRQQLAEREKYVKLMRDAIHDGCLCVAQYGEQPPDCLLEVLATTDDLSGYILCEKEPVAWEFFHSRAEPPLSVDFDDPDCIKAFPSDVVWKVPLYRAKEQGK